MSNEAAERLPQTAAGRALLGAFDAQVGWLEAGDRAQASVERTYRDEVLRGIFAIEAEAAAGTALDVGRWTVSELLEIIATADDRLNKRGDPIAAHLWLRKALDTPKPRPDHRQCRCGHVGSVHEPSPGAAKTDLGYAIEGAGPCFGRDDAAKPCDCIAAAYSARLAGVEGAG